METCSPDFQPIILAIAGLLTVQVPILVKMMANQAKIKHDVAISKGLTYTIDRKTDIQSSILANGFHGAPGAPGTPGKDGKDGKDASEILP